MLATNDVSFATNQTDHDNDYIPFSKLYFTNKYRNKFMQQAF